MSRPAPRRGFVSAEVAAEFAGLRLDWVVMACQPGPSPRPLVSRLASLADSYRGAGVVAMRTRPIPHAYRSFYRQIGLDPDVERIPGEALAVQRLLDGGFRSVDLVADACRLALLETGVPVWALDGNAVRSPGLGIRTASADDPRPPAVTPGSLVVADGSTVHAGLFAAPEPPSAVGPRTEEVALYSLAVDGVPAIHVDEALAIAGEWLAGGAPGGW